MAHERRPDPDGWAIPSASDQAQLVSSIAHCDACINIVSTMTLDAAVLDRPVVGIEFSREPASPQGIMFSEYEADHYKPVVESGGLRLARRWPELMGYLREAIENPERDREKRARLVRNECGVVDGHAADRITAALQGLLKSRGRFLQTDEKLSQIADREFSIA
jgi:CDP-glycerol glycerophosphotransferase (TagB/SpsB family)